MDIIALSIAKSIATIVVGGVVIFTLKHQDLDPGALFWLGSFSVGALSAIWATWPN